ncbi:MAG: nucleoside deaminase [Bryobacteraceae bacterium]|jgi:guanine deaminase
MNPAFLKQAIELAIASVGRGGGPFGALVAKNGAVVATGVNQVISANDPTAHAEVVVIREACRVLGSFQLSGCDLYSSCEPCPMCLGAIYWARPARVFFAATHEQASQAGFDDTFIYRQIELPAASRTIPMFRVQEPDAGAPFAAWLRKTDRADY